MKGGCEIVVNGRRLRAQPGQTLLDAALAGRIVIPHDCGTGQCNTCRVRIYDGTVDDDGTRRRDTVLACRARVTGEAVIEFDEVPDPAKRAGHVASIVHLTPDIVEASVLLEQALVYLPGQYVRATFRGFPARDYSPTIRLDGSAELNELVFQVRREPGGEVSAKLGTEIAAGHPVRVEGPFGAAFHRLGEGRLVLVSTGTGWAPIWAVARAARLREPERGMVLIAGARNPDNLYMAPALEWLCATGPAHAVMTATEPHERAGIMAGRPTLHCPAFHDTDTVYAAGAPAMVAAVEELAIAAGATCYADPFTPAVPDRSWRRWIGDRLAFRRRGRLTPAAPVKTAGPGRSQTAAGS